MNRSHLPHEIAPTPVEVRKVLTAKAQIGEGPVWDVRAQRLLWVDIVGQQLNVFDPADGSNKTHQFDDIVTSATPRAGGGVLLTLRRSFAFFDHVSGKLETIAEIEPRAASNPRSCCDHPPRVARVGCAARHGEQRCSVLFAPGKEDSERGANVLAIS